MTPLASAPVDSTLVASRAEVRELVEETRAAVKLEVRGAGVYCFGCGQQARDWLSDQERWVDDEKTGRRVRQVRRVHVIQCLTCRTESERATSWRRAS